MKWTLRDTPFTYEACIDLSLFGVYQRAGKYDITA
jgi:hypothetical protein